MTVSPRSYNQTVLDSLCEGDLIEFERLGGLYAHWAVYVGNGQIIHRSEDNDEIQDGILSSSGASSTAKIRKDDFWDVAKSSVSRKNNDKDKKYRALSPREIVKRAMSRIGEEGYSLVWNNCEHFASWCRYDIEESGQTSRGLFILFVGNLAILWAFLGISIGVAIWDARQKAKQKPEQNNDKTVYPLTQNLSLQSLESADFEG